MTRALLVLLALLAPACTTADLDDVWSKSGASTSLATRDDQECRRVAYDEAPRTVDLYVGGVADAVRVYLDDQHASRTYASCMKGRGYRNTAG